MKKRVHAIITSTLTDSVDGTLKIDARCRVEYCLSKRPDGKYGPGEASDPLKFVILGGALRDVMPWGQTRTHADGTQWRGVDIVLKDILSVNDTIERLQDLAAELAYMVSDAEKKQVAADKLCENVFGLEVFA